MACALAAYQAGRGTLMLDPSIHGDPSRADPPRPSPPASSSPSCRPRSDARQHRRRARGSGSLARAWRSRLSRNKFAESRFYEAWKLTLAVLGRGPGTKQKSLVTGAASESHACYVMSISRTCRSTYIYTYPAGQRHPEKITSPVAPIVAHKQFSTRSSLLSQEPVVRCPGCTGAGEK